MKTGQLHTAPRSFRRLTRHQPTAGFRSSHRQPRQSPAEQSSDARRIAAMRQRPSFRDISLCMYSRWRLTSRTASFIRAKSCLFWTTRAASLQPPCNGSFHPDKSLPSHSRSFFRADGCQLLDCLLTLRLIRKQLIAPLDGFSPHRRKLQEDASALIMKRR